MTDLPRRLAAEGLGTAFLAVAVVGSGIMAERLAGDGAVALLCNALATGAALVVLIATFGPISGAQFNPVVSLVSALSRALAWREAAFYGVVQVLGGIVGVLVTHAMFGLPLLAASDNARSGASLVLSEGIATFGLVFAIIAAVRFRPEAVAWIVGLYITAAYWFTASTSFANPAVTIARAMTDTFAGIRPADVPGFIAAQIAGALLAFAFGRWLLAGARTQP